MKTPYDIPEAKRWFDKAEKAARAAIKKVAAGDDEKALRDARRERDKMGDLIRWFYEEPDYQKQAHERHDLIAAGIRGAIELGVTARQESRAAEMRALDESIRSRELAKSPALRQYEKEIRLSTGRRR